MNVHQCTQAFITLMDALRMDRRDGDEIQPLLSDVITTLNAVHGIQGVKEEWVLVLDRWSKKVRDMRANDQLDEETARQLIFDVEKSYRSFGDFLSKPS